MSAETNQDPTLVTPETTPPEPPRKPDDPGRSEEAQDPDREGGVGPPPKAEPKANPEEDDGEPG